jgi:ribosome assembly protein YihI (activator of Der GTPase)
MMIKTTPAERQSHKSARRIRRLKRLVDRLGLRIALGKESVKHVDAVLKRISEQGYFPQAIDAVRRKN